MLRGPLGVLWSCSALSWTFTLQFIFAIREDAKFRAFRRALLLTPLQRGYVCHILWFITERICKGSKFSNSVCPSPSKSRDGWASKASATISKLKENPCSLSPGILETWNYNTMGQLPHLFCSGETIPNFYFRDKRSSCVTPLGIPAKTQGTLLKAVGSPWKISFRYNTTWGFLSDPGISLYKRGVVIHYYTLISWIPSPSFQLFPATPELH